MSLPTIQNLISSGLSGHYLVLAVILIFKHATFLRISNPTPGSALTRAELDYRDANIDSSIQQYLTASSQEHSVELFAAFIMATDIDVDAAGSTSPAAPTRIGGQAWRPFEGRSQRATRAAPISAKSWLSLTELISRSIGPPEESYRLHPAIAIG
ncbi:hypothetical protein EDB84DRAFT_1575169 [Lactarius hengduanensis]|nr:hypothetical protein EDB84DRAFT_1575169 [Lactarius hengduanensis]